MTVNEAAALIIDLTREVCAVRRDRDTWRLIAHTAIAQAADTERERARTQMRYVRLLEEQRARRERARRGLINAGPEAA